MKNISPNYHKPNIQEIIAFSSKLFKGKDDKAVMYDRISFYAINDDELEGIKLFLDDNQRDYNKLAIFLKPDVVHDKKELHKKLIFRIAKYAAIITLVTGITFYFIYTKQAFHQKINEYCFRDNGFVVSAGISNTISLADLVNLYRQEKSAKAIKIIEESNPIINKDTLNYLSGLIYLQANQYDKAEFKLMLVNNTNLKDKANYFRAIALLHLKNDAEAKALFIHTAKSSSDKFIQNKCNSILSDKSIWQK